MMPSLSPAESALHALALSLAREHVRLEIKIISVLQRVDCSKFFRKLGYGSLYAYATKQMKLSDALAYQYINVARKALEVPALSEAIGATRLSAASANRIVSALSELAD